MPCYDSEFLAAELELMELWFVKSLLELDMESEFKQLFEQLKTKLIANAINQKQVGVHRDFHSKIL